MIWWAELGDSGSSSRTASSWYFFIAALAAATVRCPRLLPLAPPSNSTSKQGEQPKELTALARDDHAPAYLYSLTFPTSSSTLATPSRAPSSWPGLWSTK